MKTFVEWLGFMARPMLFLVCVTVLVWVSNRRLFEREIWPVVKICMLLTAVVSGVVLALYFLTGQP
jgi:hypothetical protein